MIRRRVCEIGSVVWAGVGGVVALASLGTVNSDARLLAAAASTLGPLAAVGSAWLLTRGSDRVADVFLLLSVLTPTYFAWVLNVPALVVGLGLLVVPRAVLPQHRREVKRNQGQV